MPHFFLDFDTKCSTENETLIRAKICCVNTFASYCMYMPMSIYTSNMCATHCGNQAGASAKHCRSYF